MLERVTRAGWCACCVLGVVAGPSLLHAQDAQYRPALARLRATLDTTRTLAGVDQVAAEWAAAGSNTTTRLGGAYIALRRGIITDERGDLVSAWDDFDQVVTVHPDWPYARLGLAMAAFRLYDRRFTAPAIYDGNGGGTHYDGVVIQITRMLQSEPDFQPGIDWVAATLAAEGDRAQQAQVIQVLRLIADSAGASNPQVQLILARADRLDGNTVQSLDRVARYVRAGGDSGVALIERARSLAALDSLPVAAATYTAGSMVQTAAARDIYRLDLSWIATDTELTLFDQQPADSVAAFLRRFWAKRDARELRPAGSRLQEHLRRWVFVNQNFRVSDPGRRVMLSKVRIPNPNESCASGKRTLDDYYYLGPTYHDYRSPERVYDHRATVYMRHGEPLFQFSGDTTARTQVATSRGNESMNGYDPTLARFAQAGMTTVGPDVAGSITSRYLNPATLSTMDGMKTSQARAAVMPDPGPRPGVPTAPYTAAYADRNVTWVYNIGGEVRAFTFQGHVALGTADPTTLVVAQVPNLDVLLQLSSYSNSYTKLANAVEQRLLHENMIPLSCSGAYRQVVREQQEGAAVAVRTDSYQRRFEKPLSSMVQLAAIGQPSAGTGELMVAVGVKMEDLEEAQGASDSAKAGYVVRVQVAAIDSITGESVTVDTLRRFLARREQAGWISFVTTMPLRPGLGEFRMSVSQGEERGVLHAVNIDPPTAEFSASDIVLGGAAGPALWPHGGTSVPVNPYSSYRVDEVLHIYQELYGLTGGGSYRTVVSLRAVKNGRKKNAKVSLNFEEVASGPTHASSRELSLDNVKPGLYELDIDTEEVSTGRVVHRERSIAVYPRP